MATTAKTTSTEPKTPKAKKPPVPLATRIKEQLNGAALRGKITVDELSDLEQHIKKVAGLLA